MKVLLESCLDDLFISLIKDGKTIEYIHIENLQKKSDEIPHAFGRLIRNHQIKAKDISDFYVTKGPGSFMGVRAGLLFFSTMAQMTGANFHTCDTLLFASKGGRKFFYNAKGFESYMFNPETYKSEIVPFQEDSEIDYVDIIKHPESYLVLFELTNPSEVEANYLKEPTVG